MVMLARVTEALKPGNSLGTNAGVGMEVTVGSGI